MRISYSSQVLKP